MGKKSYIYICCASAASVHLMILEEAIAMLQWS